MVVCHIYNHEMDHEIAFAQADSWLIRDLHQSETWYKLCNSKLIHL